MDLFSLVARLTLDDKDYTNKVNQNVSNAKSFGDMLSKTAKRVSIVTTAAVTASAAAVTKIIKDAVNAYKEYEQLVGGVETLFGAQGMSIEEYAKSQGKSVAAVCREYKILMRTQQEVFDNADDAYKTAGMSANEYMETVTSMASSLIQSLGGDSTEAARLANQAIIDMADNANKMGTDIESVKAAYAGFAKQNYTMLDNLKLGYGGTKTEMDRLIADAMKLDKSFKVTTKTGKEGNKELVYTYADVVKAINIVQTEVGITGTTAKEAENTIQGSVSMTKAAWDNLLVALGSGKGLKNAIDNLVNSGITAFKNIYPVVLRALDGIGDVIQQVAPIIAENLPSLVQDVLPKLLDAAVSLLMGLVAALPGLFKVVLDAVGTLIDSLRDYLYDRNPELGQAFDNVIGFLENTWESIKVLWSDTIQPALQTVAIFVSETLVPAIATAWDWLKPKVQAVFIALAGFWNDTLKPAFVAIWTFVKDTLAPAITKAWTETIQPAIGDAIDAIVGFWEDTLSPALEAIWSYITETLAPAISEAWTETIQPAIGDAIDAIVGFWEDTLQPAFQAIWDFISDNIIPIFTSLGENISDVTETYLQPMAEFIADVFVKAWSDLRFYWNTYIIPIIVKVRNAISVWWTTILQPFAKFVAETLVEAWADIKDYWENELQPKIAELKEAFNTFKKNVLEPVGNFVKNTFLKIWEKISGFFGGSMTDSTKSLGDTFVELRDTYLKPVWRWVKQYFLTTIENIETVISGLITFITDVFEGDWEGAWDTIVDTFGTVFGRIADLLKDPINAVIDGINWMIDKIETAINSIINGINTHVRIHIEPISVFGQRIFDGLDWGANLSKVRWGRIQRLATGGFLGEGERAFVGERRPEMLTMINGHALVTPIGGIQPGDRMGGSRVYTYAPVIYQQPNESSEELAERIQSVFVHWQRQEDAVW